MVAHTFSTQPEALENPHLWFAHSASHGWVVLDRSLPANTCTAMPEEFLFTRCRDGRQYRQGDQPWNYREANRYLKGLPMSEKFEAEQKLMSIMQEYTA